MFFGDAEAAEEKKKKYGNLAKALESKYGSDKKGRLTEVLKDKGSSGLDKREVKKHKIRGFFGE